MNINNTVSLAADVNDRLIESADDEDWVDARAEFSGSSSGSNAVRSSEKGSQGEATNLASEEDYLQEALNLLAAEDSESSVQSLDVQLDSLRTPSDEALIHQIEPLALNTDSGRREMVGSSRVPFEVRYRNLIALDQAADQVQSSIQQIVQRLATMQDEISEGADHMQGAADAFKKTRKEIKADLNDIKSASRALGSRALKTSALAGVAVGALMLSGYMARRSSSGFTPSSIDTSVKVGSYFTVSSAIYSLIFSKESYKLVQSVSDLFTDLMGAEASLFAPIEKGADTAVKIIKEVEGLTGQATIAADAIEKSVERLRGGF